MTNQSSGCWTTGAGQAGPQCCGSFAMPSASIWPSERSPTGALSTSLTLNRSVTAHCTHFFSTAILNSMHLLWQLCPQLWRLGKPSQALCACHLCMNPSEADISVQLLGALLTFVHRKPANFARSNQELPGCHILLLLVPTHFSWLHPSL